MDKIKSDKLFFYIAYSLMLFEAMCNNVINFQQMFYVMDISFICLTLITLIIQNGKYNTQKFTIMVIALLFLLINYYITKDSTLIKLYLLVITFKDMEVDNFVRYDLILKIILFILVIIFSKVGWAENIIIDRADGTIRQSLGFSHPNALGAYIMSMCFSYVYLKFNKIKFYDIILICGLLIMINVFTDSRTSTLAMIFLIIFLFLNSIIKNKKMIKKFVPYLPLVFCILSFIVTLLYNRSEFVNSLDIILSRRIMYGNLFLKKYSTSLFGHNIVTVSTLQSRILNVTPQILDNSYLFLFIKYGILIFILFMMISYKSLKYIVEEYNEKNKSILTIIIIIYFMCGILENWLFKFNYNVFLIYFSIYLYRSKVGDNDEKREQR